MTAVSDSVEAQGLGMFVSLANYARVMNRYRKNGEWTKFVDTGEEVVLLIGKEYNVEGMAAALKEVSDCVQQKSYTLALRASIKFVDELLATITGLPTNGKITTMSDDGLFEAYMDEVCGAVKVANDDPNTKVIPPAIVFGLIRLLVKWRLGI